jgi:hypothetical protein
MTPTAQQNDQPVSAVFISIGLVVLAAHLNANALPQFVEEVDIKSDLI